MVVVTVSVFVFLAVFECCVLVFFEPLPVLDEREEREARWVDAAALEYVFGGESEEVVFEVGAALVEEDVLLHDGLLVGLVGVLVEFDRGFGLLRLGVAELDFDGVEVGDGVGVLERGVELEVVDHERERLVFGLPRDHHAAERRQVHVALEFYQV